MEATGIRQELKAYMEANGLTITSVAREINSSRSYISLYLSGKNQGDISALESRIMDYLSEKTGKVYEVPAPLSPAVLEARPDFFEGRDARNVIGVCQSSQEYVGLGIVVGDPGLGKTYALKYYAQIPRVAYIECEESMGLSDMLDALERALGLQRSDGTNWKREEKIRTFFSTHPGYLVVVDEADKLISKFTQKKIESLRAIFDQSPVGLVLAGEPALEIQIKNYSHRLAKRVDFYTRLNGLSEGEVEAYLGGYEVEPAALAELKFRARNTRTGCFRLLDRTLKNVFRLLEQRGEDTITMKIISEASAMMML